MKIVSESAAHVTVEVVEDGVPVALYYPKIPRPSWFRENDEAEAGEKEEP